MRKTTILIPLFAALALAGCAEDGAVRRAGDHVGEAATELASGIGMNVGNPRQVPAELSPELAKAGLSKTVAKELGDDPSKGKGISVYLIAKVPFQGRLIARALNRDGLEIGRSVVTISFLAEDAQYVAFPFGGETDLRQVERYWIGGVK